MTTEASTEKSEETTRPSESLQWRIKYYRTCGRELTSKMAPLAEEDGLKDSAATMEVLAEDEE